jgi:hypothetical protein
MMGKLQLIFKLFQGFSILGLEAEILTIKILK